MPPKGYKKPLVEKEQFTGEAIHTLPDPPKEEPTIKISDIPKVNLDVQEATVSLKGTDAKAKNSKTSTYIAFLSDKEAENREFPNAATAYRIAREKFLEVFA